MAEDGFFSCIGHARAVVEDAFFHAAAKEQGIVGIGEAVSFVADALE